MWYPLVGFVVSFFVVEWIARAPAIGRACPCPTGVASVCVVATVLLWPFIALAILSAVAIGRLKRG